MNLNQPVRIKKKLRSCEKQIEEAKRNASNIVSATRAQATALFDELEKIKKHKDKIISQEEMQNLKAGIKNMEETSDPVREKKQEDYVLPRPLKVGDDVVIFDINKDATVLELPKSGDMVLVQAGIVKTRVNIKNLRLSDGKKEKKKQEKTQLFG